MSLVEFAIGRLKKDGEGAEPPSVNPAAHATRAPEGETAEHELLGRSATQKQRLQLLPSADVTLTALGKAERHRFENQIRTIKRRLLDSADANDATGGRDIVMMITSSVPGEGKTFISHKLAASIAEERDYKVMLIDADSMQRATSRSFGAAELPGFLDLLSSDRAVDDFVYPTSVPDLFLMPSGTWTATAAEAIASERMGAVLDLLRRRPGRNVYLFDTPPLLATSEAIALAKRLEKVILVVRAGVTPESALRESVSRLDGVGQVSVVVNGISHSRLDDSYNYYGYYRP